MSKQTWKIGDCQDLMREMKPDSVDLTFADPPYNVGKDYVMYKDNLPEEEYLHWMANCIEEMDRISKRGIAIYVKSSLTKQFFNLIPDAKLIIIHKKAIGTLKANYFLQYYSLFVTAPLIRCKDLWDDIRLPGEGYFFREQRPKHPGLTSIKLTQRIIETFTERGDMVYDPFLGTGTTLDASYLTNRNCKGCELDPQWEHLYSARAHTHQGNLGDWI